MIRMLPILDALLNTSHMAERRKELEQPLNEKESALNESSKMAALALDNFVDKLRNSKQHLDKAQHWAKKDIKDRNIDRNFAILLKKHLALIKATEEMAHAIYRSRY